VSQENVELILRGFALWNAREFEATLELMDPEVEWRTGGVLPDVDDVYYGHDGVRRFWEDFMEPWETISIEPLQVSADGDEVVMLARFRARGREGIGVDLTAGQRYTVRSGKVVRFEGHPTHEEALAAAGLRDQASER
jgi:ketosteroid isomerase-like protein